MLVHPVTDEILELLWYAKESGRTKKSVTDLRVDAGEDEIARAARELTDLGFIRTDPHLELLPAGEERARGIVRRHRLAEILFAEVLDVELADAEASACEFEHMLSERVVDRVCTFLGHPPKCPHGKPIPQGSCCRIFERRVDPLIVRLLDLKPGDEAKIAFIAPRSSARLDRLAVLGVVPGTLVRLVQKKPAVVIACGETSLAIEDETAREIWMRATED